MEVQTKSTVSVKSNAIKLFALMASILISVHIIILSIIYFSIRDDVVSKIIFKERELVLSIKNIVEENLHSIHSDLGFLAEQVQYHHNRQPLDQTRFIKSVQTTFQQFSKAKKSYDQIRYIDSSGQEVVRVNFSLNNAFIVPEYKLQNKAGRYYFEDTFQLQQKEVFISPLDLNMERGKIEIPYKPMLRIGTPVFNQQKQKTGIVLLNYLGDLIIQKVKTAGIQSYGSICFMNSNGHYFVSKNSENEWGFMFEPKKDLTFKNQYPEEWSYIRMKNTRLFQSEKGIFSYDFIHFTQKNDFSSSGSAKAAGSSIVQLKGDETWWLIATHVAPDKIQTLIFEQFNLWLQSALFGFMIEILALWYLSYNIVNRKFIRQQLDKKNKELQQDLLMAEQIQKHLFNQFDPPPFIKVAARYIAQTHVSGDIYQLWTTPQGDYNVFVGDGTGHGVAAALTTIMAKMGLDEKADVTPITSLMKHLNNIFNKHLPEDRFMSAIYVRIASTGTLITSSAGHPPLIIIPKNDTPPILLKNNGLLLGIFPNDIFETTEVSYKLQPGDKLFLYTDGITERKNAKQEEFSETLLSKTLNETKEWSLDEQLNSLLETLNQFAENSEADDDITIVGLEYTGS